MQIIKYEYLVPMRDGVGCSDPVDLVPAPRSESRTFVDIPSVTTSDYRPATQRVIRSAGQASGIELRVVPYPAKP
jgi:hypothetical protein